MRMKKEQEVVQQIHDIIRRDNLQIGDALPAERKLAKEFNTSRNTVRNALRKLEAKGYVNVRRGSGYYLQSKDERLQIDDYLRENRGVWTIGEMFEARYLFEPSMGSLSARRIDGRSLAELEKCIVRLSRAIISNQTENFINGDVEFREILVKSSGNRIMDAIVLQWRSAGLKALAVFSELNDSQKDILFADYVDILHALKNRDPQRTMSLLQTNILRFCIFSMQYTDVVMPEIILEAIDQQNEDTGLERN